MNRTREMVKKILMAALIPSVLARVIALFFFAPPPDFCPPLVIFLAYQDGL